MKPVSSKVQMCSRTISTLSRVRRKGEDSAARRLGSRSRRGERDQMRKANVGQLTYPMLHAWREQIREKTQNKCCSSAVDECLMSAKYDRSLEKVWTARKPQTHTKKKRKQWFLDSRSNYILLKTEWRRGCFVILWDQLCSFGFFFSFFFCKYASIAATKALNVNNTFKKQMRCGQSGMSFSSSFS